MTKVIILDCFGVLYVDGQQNLRLLKFIQSLKTDYKMVVLTSLPRNSFDQIFSINEQSRYFDRVVCAQDLAYPKYDARCYQAVVTRLAVEPSDCLFIDDFAQNTDAAKLVNIPTLLCSNPNDVVTQLQQILKVT